MQVINTKGFEVVFTFVEHPYFGVILEANAVQLLDNGMPSLTFQRIRPMTASYFGLNPELTQAVTLMDQFEADHIMKRFYTGKKSIKLQDFLTKHFVDEVQKTARKFIENQMVAVLNLVKSYPLYWASSAGEPMGHPVQFYDEPASVLFHFRRDETGMNYFATVKHQGEKIPFYQNNSHLLAVHPTWLITQDRLLFFPPNVDGRKIVPFLNKRFIHVDPHQEAFYFEKFVAPLLENHDVYAQGFSIVTDQFNMKPVLVLSHQYEEAPKATLFFQYGQWKFPYHVGKRVNVSLEKNGDQVVFHRVRRSWHGENSKINTLKDLGLINSIGSLFGLSGKKESKSGNSLVQWFNENQALLEREGFELEQESGPVQFYLGSIELKIRIQQNLDWFDLMARVKIGAYEFPFSRFRKHILEGQHEFVLPNGEIAILPQAWFDRFEALMHLSEVQQEELRLKTIHSGLLDDLAEYTEAEFAGSEWLKTLQSGDFPDYDLPEGLQAELRPYQLEGYRWLRFMLEHHFGALLADDMGLGKTIQTLALLLHLSQKGDKPILIVAPKSLLYNWSHEAKRFAPGLKTLLYSGVGRQKMQDQARQSQAIIMSYGTMRNDIAWLETLDLQAIILDESQAIKNPSSLTARNLLKLQAPMRVALTGTPIENTLMDVWSQMNFLNKGLLGSYLYFEKEFIRPIERSGDPHKAEQLRKFIDPFVLRRTKKQVVTELPPKIEKIHYCEMSPEQQELYDRVKNQYRNELLNHVGQVGMGRARLKIFNGLMHLRQLALNPSLKEPQFSGSSGKDDEIFHMLERAIDGGHKVLIFSQFVGYLRVFEDMLQDQRIPYAYLDGSMDEKERAQAIDRFQTDPKIPVFLLSLRAGNSGINLTAADYVFLADPWWNPFTMRQAEDRAHRIGQEKTVFSYKFITKGSIEEKILALQQKKTLLAESIIPDEDSILSSLNVEELEELLN